MAVSPETQAALDALGEQFAKQMANTAIDRILRAGVPNDAVDLDLLAKSIRSHSAASLEEGLTLAKEALDCNIGPGWADTAMMGCAVEGGAKAAKTYLESHHEHQWGPVESSRFAGTVHRKCRVPGCNTARSSRRPESMTLTNDEKRDAAKALRDAAKFLRELGSDQAKAGRLYTSGENQEHHEQLNAKGRAKLARADRLDALAAKMEA